MNLMHAVTQRLDRLRAALEALAGQVRTKIAQTVGLAVAAAVRDAVHAALASSALPLNRLLPAAGTWADKPPAWPEASPPADEEGGPPPGWPPALAVGASVLAWTARRLPRAWPAWVPVTAAVAAAALAYWAGGPVAAGLAVTGTAGGLVGLADRAAGLGAAGR